MHTVSESVFWWKCQDSLLCLYLVPVVIELYADENGGPTWPGLGAHHGALDLAILRLPFGLNGIINNLCSVSAPE